MSRHIREQAVEVGGFAGWSQTLAHGRPADPDLAGRAIAERKHKAANPFAFTQIMIVRLLNIQSPESPWADISSEQEQGFIRSPSGYSQLVGFGYAGMALSIAISIVIMMVRLGMGTTAIVISSVSILLGSLFVVILHYANHTCEQLADSLLQMPKFHVSSMGHLRLAAVPLVLLAIGMVMFALPGAITAGFSAFTDLAESRLYDRFSGLLLPLLLILLGVSTCRLFLGVLLNPAKVGIVVRSDTSSAETTLAISAAVARAPLSIVRQVHQSGVVAGCLAAIAILVVTAGLQHYLLLIAITVCLLWSLGALLWPIVSYVAYFMSMFGIELLQSFLMMTRDVAAIARQRQADER